MNWMIKFWGMRGALLGLILLLGLQGWGQTATYNISAGALINCASNCGSTGSYYNGCGGLPIGFSWTDGIPAGNNITAVSIQVMFGIDCIGGTHTTSMNGAAGPNVNINYNCACDGTTNGIATLAMPAGSYVRGGSNNFYSPDLGSCYGFYPGVSGYYAIVTVTYAPACTPPTNTTPTTAICSNGTKTLSGSPGGGTFTIASGGGNISGGTTYNAAGYVGSVTINYTVPSCSTPTPVTFTVNAGPSLGTLSNASICTGGTVQMATPYPTWTGGASASSNGTYRVVTFTSNGNFIIPTGYTGTFDVLVVGGGGGGGSNGGGGGGAGGFIEMTGISASGSIPITVGTGGAVHNNTNPPNTAATNGTQSRFGDIVAAGGGGGGASRDCGLGGQAGGSVSPVATYYAGGSGGGGGGAQGANCGGGNGVASRRVPGAGACGNWFCGFTGGHGAGATNTDYGCRNAGGGGGGANSAGTTVSPYANNNFNVAGIGGTGKSSSITGTATTYAIGGNGGPVCSSGGSYASWGAASSGQATLGAAGTANRGNGGSGNGGVGGSGVVIIRYINPEGGTWSSSTGAATVNSSGLVTGGSGGTPVITYTTPSVGGCTASTAATVTVVSASAPAQPSTITGTTNPCPGSSQTYSVTNVAGVSYAWTFPSGWTVTPSTTNSITVTPSTTAGTITVTPSTTCGGNGTARTLSVTPAYSVPAVSIAASPTGNICAGTSVTFTATPTNGGTNPIYNFRVGGVSQQSGTSNTYTTTGLTNGQVVDCIITPASICVSPTTATSNSITMAVTSTVAPAVSIAITNGANPSCSGSSVTFTASPTNGGTTPTYNFRVNGSTVQNTTSNIYTTTGLTNGQTVTCIMTSNATCPSPTTATSNSIVMTVTALPSAPTPVTASPTNACPTATTNLNGTSAGNNIQWWTASTGGSLLGTSASGANFPITTPVANTTYYAAAVSGGSGSQTFNYTGSAQTFTVPGGVTSITIDAYGAQGGSSSSAGGLGGRSQGTLSVSGGQVLNIYVGGQNGWNGGGTGGNTAGAGGGASDIRVGGTGFANRVIVAGGGGGSGLVGGSWTGAYGGTGGGVSGGQGGSSSGYTGTQGALGGGGGSSGSGGAGSAGCGCGPGGTGVLGTGGNGVPCSTWGVSGGGGGGGGYYGGGAGGVCGGGDGGGGGSSYTGGVSGGSTTAGVRSGNGQVVITWTGGASCPSATRTAVNVVPMPSPTDNTILANGVATSTTICLGQSVTISSSGGSTSNYCYWASTDGGTTWNILSGENCNTASFSYTPPAVGTYRFHVRNSDACGYCWDVGRSCPTWQIVDVTVTNVSSPAPAVTAVNGASYTPNTIANTAVPLHNFVTTGGQPYQAVHLGRSGMRFDYTAGSGWPLCANWGLPSTVNDLIYAAGPAPPANTAAYSDLAVDLTHADTDLAAGKLCFTGNTNYYILTTASPSTPVNTPIPVRFRVIASKPFQYITSGHFLLRANSNFNVTGYMEAYAPSNGYYYTYTATGNSSGSTITLTTANAYIRVGVIVTGAGITGNRKITAISSDGLTLTLSSAVNTNLNGQTFSFTVLPNEWVGAVTLFDYLYKGNNTSSIFTNFSPDQFYNFNAAPTVTTNPATVCLGSTFTLQGSNGTYISTPCPLTYSWTGPTSITNATSINATTSTTSNGTYNFVLSSDKVCYAKSSITVTPTATLSAVGITPTTTQNVCATTNGSLLTAAETGGGTITGRQWGKRSVSGGAITPIGGATGNTYTPTGASLGAGTWYVVCTSTPTCGTATISNEVTVNVSANLSAVSVTPITTQTFCAATGGSLLTAAETGGGTITGRQWGKRSVSGGAITPIGGATGNTYTPTGASLGAGTWYVVCTSTPTCGTATVSNEVTVTVNPSPIVTNFSLPSATAPCQGAATVTVNSSTLVNGTYTVTYNLTGANTATGNTASMTFSSGAGTFNTSSLGNSGATTVTVTSITNSSNCSATLSSGNTVNVTVNSNPVVSNFSIPSISSPCVGTAATVTINSTSLTTGTYTVTYNLGAPNATTGATASMNFTAGSPGSGTFNTGNLASSGATAITITSVTNSVGCAATVSSGNTGSITVNTNTVVTNFSLPSATAPCQGAATVTVNSSSLANGTYTVTYNLSVPNAATGNTATMTFSGGTGTFTTSTLSNAGATTVTVTSLTNSNNCSSSPSSGNTILVTVNTAPNTGTFTMAGPATPLCNNTPATVGITSSLANGTYTVTYNLSAPNLATGNTATLVMSGGTGSFNTSNLASNGTTTITVTQVAASNGCAVTFSSGNTATAVVNSVVEVAATAGVASACYPTVKGAFDKINDGTHRGVITVMIKGNTTEAPAAVLNASGSGLANYTSVNMYPTVANLTVSGSLNTPIIDLNGADNVTIDGRLNGSGTSKSLTIQNSNNGTTAGNSAIRLINGAQSNTIRDLIIKARGRTTTGGAVLFHTASAGNGNNNNLVINNDITGIDATNRPDCGISSVGTAGSENTNNTISNNNIFNTWPPERTGYGILVHSNSKSFTVSGNSIYETTAFAPTEIIGYRAIQVSSGATNGGHTISNNFIGGTASSCGGTAMTLNSSTVPYLMYGIIITTANSVNDVSSLQGNTIANINISTKYSDPFRGIQVDAAGGAWDIGTITGNTIGAASGTGNITINSLNTNASQVTATATVNMSGTSIQSVTVTNPGGVYSSALSAANTLAALRCDGGTCSPTTAAVFNASTITSSGGYNTITLNGGQGGAGYSGVVTMVLPAPPTSAVSYGMLLSSNGTLNVQNNRIAAINVVGGSDFPHNFYGIYRNAGATAAAATISNNFIGSSTGNSINCSSPTGNNAVAQSIWGIRNNSASACTMSGNIVENLNNSYNGTATSFTVGMDGSNGSNTITNNIIRNITSASASTGNTSNSQLQGIRLATTTASTTQTISGNTIHNLTASNGTAAVHVTGIYVGALATGNHTVSENFIHSLTTSSSSTSASVFGIRVNTGSATYSNNIINLGSGIPNSNTIYGIYETGAATNNYNFYHNSIYIGGTASGNANTYAMYSNVNTNVRDYRNNVFVNARSRTGGTGTHYGMFFNITSTGSLTLDYNNYYVSGTGGVLGRYNSANVSALPLITGRDANSVNINPAFASPGGITAANYIPATPNNGANNTGIGTDYAGTNRVCAFTMGAYEVPANPAAPAAPSGNTPVCPALTGISYTIPLVNNATSYNWTVPTGWNITSGSGTNTITVTSGTVGQNGNIAVSATNACGTSSVTNFPVTVALPASGSTTRWTGLGAAGNDNWNLSNNWDNCVPNINIHAILGNDIDPQPVNQPNINTVGINAKCKTLTLPASSTLTISSNCINCLEIGNP